MVPDVSKKNKNKKNKMIFLAVINKIIWLCVKFQPLYQSDKHERNDRSKRTLMIQVHTMTKHNCDAI